MVIGAGSSPAALASERGLPPDYWRGRRATVMGLGTHGGGVGAVRFLAEHGARVTLTDLRSDGELAESLDQLQDVEIDRLLLGGHDESAFRDAEVVVVNPAVRCDHPLLQFARERGAFITTEVGLLWQHTTASVVAVTGSVGKSTTVSMIDAVLKAASRRCWLGGNIGGSLLPHAASISAKDWLVLELSSFQLGYLAEVEFRPEVAVVTNFSPNHLDWHGTIEDYRNCKQQLLSHQSPSGVAVLNADDRGVSSWRTRGRVAWFGRAATSSDNGVGRVLFNEAGCESIGFATQSKIAWQDLPSIQCEAMRRNAAAAIAACLSLEIDSDAIIKGLQAFTPLPYRFEILGDVAGRRWINDSKATTPSAAIAAIRSCDSKPWVLLGGAGKNVDLRSFCESIADQIRGAALIGETSAQLQALLSRFHPTLPLRICRTIEEAVEWLADVSAEWDTVLLSPACASLDQFRDYVDRGDRFRDAVMRLKVTSSTTAKPAA